MSTRYAQVARQLASDIAEGLYPVGTTLPNEPMLAQTLGVSRATLRTALGELQKLGLVSRRPSLGTKVEAARPAATDQGFAQTLGSIEAIVQYAADTLRDDIALADVVADRDLAARLGAEPGSNWLRVSYRRVDRTDRRADPICWTDVYVASAYAEPVRDRAADHRGAISELVEEAAGRRISQVEQTLRASGVPERVSDALKAAVDSHALHITRRYFLGAAELVEVSISIHPGDRFAYVSKLSRTV